MVITAQPIAARFDGRAANSASPIVGLQASTKPSVDGMNTAAVTSGDHCACCATKITEIDPKTQSGPGRRHLSRVSTKPSAQNPTATKSVLAQRSGSAANGNATSTAGIG